MRLSPFALRFSLLWLALCAALAPLAHAQTPAATAALTVDPSNFPDLSAYLALTNAQGVRMSGLAAPAFALSEDNQAIRQFAVTEEEVGVQAVFAIDTSAAFKARDANGVTRLEYIQQALADFSQNVMRDNLDDVTVLAPESLLIGHSTAGGEVMAAVRAYATEFTGAADPFSVYNTALDYAASLPPRAGMRSALVLLSNGLPGGEAQTRAADLAARAVSAGVPIHTVFIGPLGAGNTANAQFLRALAQQTGGDFIIYESPADFAPLFQRLADQRTQYRFTYRSTIDSTAQHTLAINITLPDGAAIAANASFPLRVEPPTVTLAAPAEQELAASAQLALPFTVDFPDNHPRDLRSAQLLVNGQTHSTLTAPPFESFAWPVAASGVYTLAVQVTDELGLTALSEPASVNITMTIPPTVAVLATNTIAPPPAGVDWKTSAVLGSLLLAALMGGWFLIRRRRVAPPAPTASVMMPEPTPNVRSLPTTAPLVKPRPRALGPFTLQRRPAPMRVRPEKPRGRAYFEVVDSGGGGAPFPDIELLDQPVRLGRDGALADVIFHDRSVSRLHARVEATPEGAFNLFDEGSTSGTWVNFTAIAAETGHTLQPGDLINLGRVQLRFKRRDIQSVSTEPPSPA